ncbi:hypothetical protein BCR32DRAFT_276777 [Anaeromyces robustus]|uniref:Uncharacterized protein n=1 Tax=Anaeromyces robustus TaxID=1754192 RepID=A0A1Y1XGE9_9FUNG|nr:hypothetical protein BCR32DRAFT_276777 [Anaeromyces robustus]|eukprot:ORX84807.1 hypothetical protein BCR32DRAFT_276777 [Anaeromyces robustus]
MNYKNLNIILIFVSFALMVLSSPVTNESSTEVPKVTENSDFTIEPKEFKEFYDNLEDSPNNDNSFENDWMTIAENLGVDTELAKIDVKRLEENPELDVSDSLVFKSLIQILQNGESDITVTSIDENNNLTKRQCIQCYGVACVNTCQGGKTSSYYNVKSLNELKKLLKKKYGKAVMAAKLKTVGVKISKCIAKC